MAFERANPRLDQATIHFQLRVTRTAQSDAATALTLQMRPTTDQTGRDVLQLREFDLQLAFVRTRARRENVKNQAGAPEHACLDQSFELALLTRCQRMIEDHELGARCHGGSIEVLRFAGTDEQTQRGKPPSNT